MACYLGFTFKYFRKNIYMKLDKQDQQNVDSAQSKIYTPHFE